MTKQTHYAYISERQVFYYMSTLEMTETYPLALLFCIKF